MKHGKHTAILALAHPTTTVAMQHGRVTAAIQKHQGLFALRQGFFNRLDQDRGQTLL
jgi:hypothetical protein